MSRSDPQPFDLIAAIGVAREQAQAGAGSVLDVLLRTPGVDKPTLLSRMQHEAGVAIVLEGDDEHPDFEVLDFDAARAIRCVALKGDTLRVALEDPWDEDLLHKAGRALGQTPAPVAVASVLLARWLGTASEVSQHRDDTDPMAIGPVVAFVDQALQSGLEKAASDVHFECDREGVSAKHRIDGVLRPFARLTGVQKAMEVISRIKVMAQLDITERRLPQDGRMRVGSPAGEVDVRISIMPSVHGEDAVLRLLDQRRLKASSEGLTLERLGFDGRNLVTIRDMAQRPSGMLLVTGPTGSGKTTTVYAALSEINTGEEKIVTIEDPVEYELHGVLQIPVNERKGLTFAKGLRSILRHDPDRILVGEIRDAETAEIAVQSALTGHLVFTTVHANSLPDVVGRFRHFGIDMFGFMSSMNGIVVQRLIRRLCAECRGQRTVEEPERAWLARCGGGQPENLPVAVGCGLCQGTGYRGRFVIAEVHEVDDRLRDAVISGSPMSEIRTHVAHSGAASLQEVAAASVLAGDTTSEEVRRVVGWR